MADLSFGADEQLILSSRELTNKFLYVTFIYGKANKGDKEYPETTLKLGSNVQCELSCKVGLVPNKLSGLTKSLAEGGISMKLKIYTSPIVNSEEYTPDLSSQVGLYPVQQNIIDFIKEADLDNPVYVEVEYGYHSLPANSSIKYRGQIFKVSNERDTSNNQPYIVVECVNATNADLSLNLSSKDKKMMEKTGNGTIFLPLQTATYKSVLFYIFNLSHRVYGDNRYLIQDYDDITRLYGIKFSNSFKETFDELLSYGYKYELTPSLHANHNNKMYVFQPLQAFLDLVRKSSVMTGKAMYLSFEGGMPLWSVEKYAESDSLIMFTNNPDGVYNIARVEYIDDSLIVDTISTPDNWSMVDVNCVFSPYFLNTSYFIIQSKYFSTYILDQKIKKDFFKTDVKSLDKQKEKGYNLIDIEKNLLFLITAEIDFSTVGGSGTPTMRCTFSSTPHKMEYITPSDPKGRK